jgi:hypothetical protein
MEEGKQPKYLSRYSAAVYLRAIYGLSCTPDTLAKKAVTGYGPPFRKAGRSVHSTAGLPPRDYRPKGRPCRTFGEGNPANEGLR